jgi:hypothetical protein
MPLSQGKWSSYLKAGLVALTSGITIYLLLSDSARRAEIRRRKAILSKLDDETPQTALETAQTRFGVLRVGGRFVNPFEEYFPRDPVDVDGANRGHGNGQCGKS